MYIKENVSAKYVFFMTLSSRNNSIIKEWHWTARNSIKEHKWVWDINSPSIYCKVAWLDFLWMEQILWTIRGFVLCSLLFCVSSLFCSLHLSHLWAVLWPSQSSKDTAKYSFRSLSSLWRIGEHSIKFMDIKAMDDSFQNYQNMTVIVFLFF